MLRQVFLGSFREGPGACEPGGRHDDQSDSEPSSQVTFSFLLPRCGAHQAHIANNFHITEMAMTKPCAGWFLVMLETRQKRNVRLAIYRELVLSSRSRPHGRFYHIKPRYLRLSNNRS
jgi:hypothetical protein